MKIYIKFEDFEMKNVEQVVNAALQTTSAYVKCTGRNDIIINTTPTEEELAIEDDPEEINYTA